MATSEQVEQSLINDDIVIPVQVDMELLGHAYLGDYGIPSAAELGIE